MLMSMMLLALGLVLASMAILWWRRPIIARLGLRNIPRRPAQSLLIVTGLVLSTTIIVSALALGDTLNYSIRRQAVEAYGAIDEILIPPFVQDLLALLEDEELSGEGEQAQWLASLTRGDLDSVVTLLAQGVPGIPIDRYEALRAQVAGDPHIDGVASAIVFPTIVRDVDSGQGEPLGFIFAVDPAFDEAFGLHDTTGGPVRVADLRPGVGPVFTGVASAYRSLDRWIARTAESLGAERVGLPEVIGATIGLAAVLTAEEGPSFTLRDLRVDLDTLRRLGIDTAPLEARGVDELSLETLGISDELLSRLGIDPDRPITLPTLRDLGLQLQAADVAGTINLNTLGRDLDQRLAGYGLQLRQGEVYLNRLGAERLNARPGDLLEIFIGPIPVSYRVRAIVSESGPVGALAPVVIMDVREAQQLLFMSGRVNAILVSNRGDMMTGIAETDAAVARLRALSLRRDAVSEAAEILRRRDVAEVVAERAERARNPAIGLPAGAPQLLEEWANRLLGVEAFSQRARDLAMALTDPEQLGCRYDGDLVETCPPLVAALSTPAVRDWLLTLPLPGDASARLEALFSDMDEFLVLDPLTKAFAVEGAELAGAAFSTMFAGVGSLSILAGAVLIFLIFVMLAAERRQELGIARAIGTQRLHVVQMFATEGMVYDLAAALLGLGLGLAVASGVIAFIRRILADVSQNLGAVPFQLYWSVSTRSLVIAYCGGVILTFAVVTVSSWHVSRLNIVAAIRGLGGNAGGEGVWLRRFGRALVGPGAVLVGAWLLYLGRREGQTVTLIGLSLLLLGVGQSLEWAPVWPSVHKRRLVYSAIGLGWVVLWGTPWPTLLGARSILFRQNPAYLLLSFVLAGPLVIIGAILVILFNADLWSRLAMRALGRLRTLAPVLRTAIAYPLANPFRTGTTILLFAMVMTAVTVMNVVIRATELAATPEMERTLGFEVEVSSGLLSFFDPVTDLWEEARQRPDFPLDQITEIAALAPLDVEGRQVGAINSRWWPIRVTGVDAGYAARAKEVYTFRARAEGYASDETIWDALARGEDVAVVKAWRVVGGSRIERERGADQPQFQTLRLTGIDLERGVFSPVWVELRRTLPDGTQALRRVRVIGVLEPDDTLAPGSIHVSRAVVDALNGEPVRPERFYIDVVPGADPRAVAQAIERAMLSSGMNAVALEAAFGAGQAVMGGIIRLFQAFLALGLIVGIAGLGVVSGRAVIERRQQIGVLRAIGYRRGMVALGMVLEASFIALTGLFIGATTGVVLGDKMIGQFYTLATDQIFPMPWLSIAGMGVLAWLFSLVATLLPAWQASRVFPAEALRYE